MFSMFLVLICLVILAVGFVHYVQGFFSSAISAVLAIIAAGVAVSYHETVAAKFLVSRSPDFAHGVALIFLYAITYLVLRILFDMAVPGNVRLPAAADKAGGAVLGLVVGIFTAGIVAMAAQYLPFFPSIAGYSRYEVTDKDASVRGSGTRNLDRTMRDILKADDVEDPQKRQSQTSLMVPVDDIMLNTVQKLSNGPLSGGQSLSRVHPDWLLELFGQRLGIEPGARRVAIFDDKTQDVRAEGVYLLDPKNIEQREGDLKVARVTQRSLPLKLEDASRMLVAVRIFFTDTAKDADSLIRFSPGSIRLVSKIKRAAMSDYEYVDYYPIGTLDAAKFLYVSRMDDFMFINPRAEKKALGVDLVFYVLKEGFAVGGATKGQYRVASDACLEVKRMAWLNVGGMEIKPIQKNDEVAVMRKASVIEQATQKPAAPPPSDDEDPDSKPKVAAPGAPPKPAAPSGSAAKLQGTWESAPQEGTVTSVTFGSNTIVITRKNAVLTKATKANWTQKSGPDDEEVAIHCTPSEGTMTTLDLTISVQGDKMNMTNPDGGDDLTLTKKK